METDDWVVLGEEEDADGSSASFRGLAARWTRRARRTKDNPCGSQADSAAAALEICEKDPVAFVLSDQKMPGTTGILAHVNRILGYDFTPHLPALWHDDEPDAADHRANYHQALDVRHFLVRGFAVEYGKFVLE